MCEDKQSTGIWLSVSSGFSSRKVFIGNSQASDYPTMQSLSVALHVNSIADMGTFIYFTSVQVVCIVGPLLALLTWARGVKCRLYCFIDVLFPVVTHPHFFQHLHLAPTTLCNAMHQQPRNVQHHKCCLHITLDLLCKTVIF